MNKLVLNFLIYEQDSCNISRKLQKNMYPIQSYVMYIYGSYGKLLVIFLQI